MSLRKETIIDLLKLSATKLPTALLTSDDIVRDGDTFTVTYYGEPNVNYTITGVTSADIGGEPLTGTFTASGEQLVFTVTDTGSLTDKNFTLSLDNGQSSIAVFFRIGLPIYSLGVSSRLGGKTNWSGSVVVTEFSQIDAIILVEEDTPTNGERQSLALNYPGTGCLGGIAWSAIRTKEFRVRVEGVGGTGSSKTQTFIANNFLPNTADTFCLDSIVVS